MSDYWTPEELARFSYFELDGVRSPGVLVLDLGEGTPRKWDEQNGFGLSGSFIKFTGLGLAEFTLSIRLVDAADRAAFDSAAWRRRSARRSRRRTQPTARSRAYSSNDSSSSPTW